MPYRVIKSVFKSALTRKMNQRLLFVTLKMGSVIPVKLFKILKGCEQYDVIKKKENIPWIA